MKKNATFPFLCSFSSVLAPFWLHNCVLPFLRLFLFLFVHSFFSFLLFSFSPCLPLSLLSRFFSFSFLFLSFWSFLFKGLKDITYDEVDEMTSSKKIIVKEEHTTNVTYVTFNSMKNARLCARAFLGKAKEGKWKWRKQSR